ncbi:MAG: M20/M25/M40 family metallo-hydrolase [Armatimonadetes bacterium]|nr:M20/M25/M40 family metallo-hydrolase [Armatimonadota bacterium]
MSVHEHPAELLRRLIQFDTTNPPGCEVACVGYINDLLTAAGFETTLLARDPERPNLIARLAGEGSAPPLLLYGHVDVVTTAGQVWQHPPFEGRLVDGFVWGRGALDMKGGVAMMLAALLRARAEGLRPAGGVVLAILCDEEANGEHGARFLVEDHAGLFDGIRYAIGEFGGFSMPVGGRTFYPIQVAEKRSCWLRATVRGPGGHGALPMQGGAMASLGRVLRALDRRHLPVRVTPVARQMIEAVAGALRPPSSWILRTLLDTHSTDAVLALMGERGRMFSPLLRNTVNATIVRGGEKVNVIPSEIVLDMDGRLLPGCGPGDLITDLRPILGPDVALSEAGDAGVIRHDPGPASPDMGMFDLLAGILRDQDPGGIPVPYLMPGATDGRFFARLGIQTYGFLPMRLPEGMNFSRLVHAADERIPSEAVEFGTRAILEALRRFGRAR